jgi:hypothetical protein
MDPDRAAIAAARASIPPELRERVRFEVASPVDRNEPRRRFDVAFFSWSL